MSRQDDDIHNAAAITQILVVPKQTLETFGTTIVRYHLVSAVLDQEDRVRVRTGKLYSERPQIVTPGSFARQLLDGFGDSARNYADWLMSQGEMMQILKYGLRFRKDDMGAEVLSGTLEEVAGRIKENIDREGSPLSAVIVGSDPLWEVSLLKFLYTYVTRSAPSNIRDLAEEAKVLGGRGGLDSEIEADFRAASLDRKRVNYLGKKLQKLGLFERYEDRFYALLRQHRMG